MCALNVVKGMNLSMIKYPKDLYINEHMEFKLGKERRKLLEKTLRLIGNFDNNKPIVIEDYEVITFSDIIFKIKDKDNTVYSFISFGLSYGKDNNRYSKNFHLTMKKENSNFIYKYDFDNIDGHLNFGDQLEVIEIEQQLSDSRKLKVKRGRYHSINLEIEEQDKKYVISIYNNYKSVDDDEHDLPLLENLETIIEEIKTLEKLNLENIINITNKKVGISGCYIYYKDKEIAGIDYLNDEIRRYNIIKENFTINTSVYPDKIERETERKIDNDIIKGKDILTDENYEIIQSDIQKILKLM